MRSACAGWTRSARGNPGCVNAKTKEHLIWAAAQSRTLFGFNVRDFYRLHTEFLMQGRSHAGIILAKQQHYSVGEQMRRLLKLVASRSAEGMKDQVEFFSAWG